MRIFDKLRKEPNFIEFIKLAKINPFKNEKDYTIKDFENVKNALVFLKEKTKDSKVLEKIDNLIQQVERKIEQYG